MTETQTFRMLMCEGRCNATTTFERYVQLERASAQNKTLHGRSPCDVDGLAEAVRAVVYTRHRMDGWKFATCTVCDHQRRCG